MTMKFPSLPLLTLALTVNLACGGDEDDTDEMTTADAPMGGAAGSPASAEAEAEDDEPIDNVAACERLAADLSCGGIDLTMSLGCEAYGTLECDLVDYFDCVADNFECTSDVPDVSGLTACVDLATCD